MPAEQYDGLIGGDRLTRQERYSLTDVNTEVDTSTNKTPTALWRDIPSFRALDCSTEFNRY